MANETIRARIEVLLRGMDQVESLKNAVRQLQSTAAPASADLQKLRNAATQLGGAADRTENDLRRSINALKDVRAQLSLTDTEYRKLTKTINEYQKALDKATGTQRSGGGGSRTGQAIGAIASGAIFGGPEGFLGGLAGAGIGAATGAGAVAGSFAGAAAGATVGLLRQQVTGASDYAGEIARLQIALKGVSTDQAEFNDSLKFIQQSAPQFLTSLGDATKNYIRLQASVRGAGLGVDDTQKVFKGLSAAIVATGGSTEQLNGAMLAASQVFSKGKVSAEELRGQIGERLPGAFTIFAQAVNMTPQQLDKALEQGKVTTEQFVKFSEELFKRYGKAAESIGSSPFAASIKFQLAMDNFKLAAGQALLPIISSFQNLGTEGLNALTRVIEGTTGWQKALGNTFQSVSKLIGGVQGLKDILSGLTKTLIVLGTTMAGVFAVQNIGAFVGAFRTVVTVTTTLVKVTRELLTLEKAITALKAIQAGLGAVSSGVVGSLKKNAKGVAGGALALGAGAFAAAAFSKQIDAAIGGIVDSIGGKFNDLFKMPDLGGNFGGATPQVPPADGSDPEKVAKDAERQAQEQQRLNEEIARQQIELQNAIHRNAMELIRRKYDYEQERIRQQRELIAGSYEGAASESMRAFTEYLNSLDDLRKRVRDSEMEIKNAEQALKSAKAYEAVTSQGLGGGAPALASGGNAIFGATGNVSNAPGWVHGHMQSFGTASELVLAASDVVQKLLAQGIKVYINGVGDLRSNMSEDEIRAAVERGRRAHTHSGDGRSLDVFVPQGTGVPVPLTGVGSMGARGGIGGMISGTNVAIMHLDPRSRAGGGVGSAVQVRRDTRAEGDVSVAGADLALARGIQKLDADQVKALEPGMGQLYVQQQTKQLRDQAKALEDSNSLLARRAELEAMGVRSEVIEGSMKIVEIERQRKEALLVLTDKLNMAKDLQDPAAIKTANDEIAQTNALYDRQVLAIEAGVAAQIKAGAALNAYIGKQRQALDEMTRLENVVINVSQAIESSLSTAISTAVTNFATGSGSIKQVLADLFKSVGSAFIKMAADIIAKQLVMVALNSLLGAFGGGGGGGFLSGSGALSTTKLTPGGIFATGGVMTSAGPLPLKRYASGGVAKAPQVAVFGERGPEAYVPLPDGRSIPVKMKQRNEALNRYRPIGATGTMAPDGEAAAAGGAAGGAAGPIDVRYSVERINNVEYVTAEQFQQGLRQAAAQGAQRGEQRAIRSLQQSTAVRSRVGMR